MSGTPLLSRSCFRCSRFWGSIEGFLHLAPQNPLTLQFAGEFGMARGGWTPPHIPKTRSEPDGSTMLGPEVTTRSPLVPELSNSLRNNMTSWAVDHFLARSASSRTVVSEIGGTGPGCHGTGSSHTEPKLGATTGRCRVPQEGPSDLH